MRKLMVKAAFLTIIVYGIVVGVNCVVDPANIFHAGVIEDMVEALASGKIIESPGDFDEGVFVKGMVDALDKEPSILILGSSHTMYVPWEEIYGEVFVGGLSGAYLGDYYAVLGLLESRRGIPKRVIIGVDPWAFYMDALSGRHKSIAEYAEYEKNIIEGMSGQNQKISVNRIDYEKIRELFSFSYFQSAVARLRGNGIDYYLDSRQREVFIAEDDSVGYNAKILPNGRYVMGVRNYKTVAENEADAQNAIDTGEVYQLSDGFTELQEDNLDEFKSMVEYLRSKGVEVELYLPAWYPALYDFFQKEEKFAGVIKSMLTT